MPTQEEIEAAIVAKDGEITAAGETLSRLRDEREALKAQIDPELQEIRSLKAQVEEVREESQRLILEAQDDARAQATARATAEQEILALRATVSSEAKMFADAVSARDVRIVAFQQALSEANTGRTDAEASLRSVQKELEAAIERIRVLEEAATAPGGVIS